MEIKDFQKELKKAVAKFERHCKKEGEICDPVRVGLVDVKTGGYRYPVVITNNF